MTTNATDFPALADTLTAFKVAGGALNFSSYYKYSFTFSGAAEGYMVIACFGREAYDIYKFSVEVGKPAPLPLTEAEVKANWHSFRILHNNEVIYDHYSD